MSLGLRRTVACTGLHLKGKRRIVGGRKLRKTLHSIKQTQESGETTPRWIHPIRRERTNRRMHRVPTFSKLELTSKSICPNNFEPLHVALEAMERARPRQGESETERLSDTHHVSNRHQNTCDLPCNPRHKLAFF